MTLQSKPSKLIKIQHFRFNIYLHFPTLQTACLYVEYEWSNSLLKNVTWLGQPFYCFFAKYVLEWSESFFKNFQSPKPNLPFENCQNCLTMVWKEPFFNKKNHFCQPKKKCWCQNLMKRALVKKSVHGVEFGQEGGRVGYQHFTNSDTT